MVDPINTVNTPPAEKGQVVKLNRAVCPNGSTVVIKGKPYIVAGDQVIIDGTATDDELKADLGGALVK